MVVQGGTALSSGEVGQGYREVADPSVYVRFPLISLPLPPSAGWGGSGRESLNNSDLLVWTTTPWTLPSNQFAAVKPDLEYSIVRFDDESRGLIMASVLVEEIAKKSGKEARVEATIGGADLGGLRYVPPFNYYYKASGECEGRLKSDGTAKTAWRVIAADFVTTDTGTGIVHQVAGLRRS